MIAHRFVKQRTHFAARFSLIGKRIVTTLCDKVRHEQRYRGEQNHRDGNKPVLKQHEYKRADYRDYSGKQLLKTLQQSVGNLIDVVYKHR